MTPLHAAAPALPVTEAPLAAQVERVLWRVRLRARCRAAWLRRLWREEEPPLGGPVTHAEADGLMMDRDAPEAEAEWLAASQEAAAARAALEEVERALEEDGGSRLATLVRTFGLAAGEADVVQTCLALALDPTLARLCAYLQDDAARRHVTEPLVARLFQHGRGLLLPAHSPLWRWELLRSREVAPGEPPALELDAAVRDWLLGLDGLDPELAGIARVVAPLEPLPGWPVEETALSLARILDGGRPPRIRLHLAGPPGSGKRTLAACVAARLGLMLLAVDSDGAPEGTFRQLFQRAQRRAWLDRCALAWSGETALRTRWPGALPWFPLQFVLSDGQESLPPARGVVDRRAEMPSPSLDERLDLWRTHLPASASWPPEALHRLVVRHPTTAGQIAEARWRDVRGPDEAEALLRDGARRELGDLAQRLECPFGWDDLVLPETLRRALEELVFEAGDRSALWERAEARRLFPQGRALLALFTGPPGTGKTMAAQVIAAELGVDLYRVDLSAVVSKYVGETSRNLERVLRRASDLDLVLLFDECEALFGRRTKVEDAHDRFANTDTSHLLQAIESYRGVALLASNRRGDMDAAFTRRLRYVLDFPPPDAERRAVLWRKLVEAMAGTARLAALDADLAALARMLEVSGAQIKYAVLTGLFLSRRHGVPLGLRHLLRGVERELVKEGRGLGPRVLERWARDVG